jgi:uncharacterized protein involved in exopolysaccharide biosynthesis
VTTPLTGAGNAGLGNLVSQLGVGLGQFGFTRQLPYYATLARSDDVLGRVVQERYQFEQDDSLCACDLVTYFRLDRSDRPRAQSVALAVRRLRGRVGASYTRENSLLEIVVTMRDAGLAAQVNRGILAELNRLDLAERTDRAADEGRYIQERVGVARAEQTAAEDALEKFLTENREFRSSPSLAARFQRLQTEVQLRQQATVSLVQAFEKARLDQHRDTRVLVVVSQPSEPALPDARGLIVRTFIAGILGLGLGAAITWSREVFHPTGMAHATPVQLVHLIEETMADVRRPWRLLRE